MPSVVNFAYISVISYFSRKGSKIYQIDKKSQQEKFGKSKMNYYDVIHQTSQFACKFV